ncbi:hypothetical protein FGO68_gene736 [Halteria grandinella]|uniref:Dynein light chain n=1 Tax=Halteria grandinella TaxID=5974 RepID=A0A8J8NH34_HALGN|nr:hypothetical protein FGO68_gene736 [Halteria grandinella]
MSSSEEEEVIIPVPKNRVRFSDMPWTHQEKAIRLINEIAQKHKLDKDLATEVKLVLDKEPLLQDECGGWHVIVGKSFASAITYQTKWVLFFDLLEGGFPKTYLLFKTQ